MRSWLSKGWWLWDVLSLVFGIWVVQRSFVATEPWGMVELVLGIALVGVASFHLGMGVEERRTECCECDYD